jgi:hypothetical protein
LDKIVGEAEEETYSFLRMAIDEAQVIFISVNTPLKPMEKGMALI